MRRIRITRTEYAMRYALYIITSTILAPFYLLYKLLRFLVRNYLLQCLLIILGIATLVGLHAIPGIITEILIK